MLIAVSGINAKILDDELFGSLFMLKVNIFTLRFHDPPSRMCILRKCLKILIKLS